MSPYREPTLPPMPVPPPWNPRLVFRGWNVWLNVFNVATHVALGTFHVSKWPVAFNLFVAACCAFNTVWAARIRWHRDQCDACNR